MVARPRNLGRIEFIQRGHVGESIFDFLKSYHVKFNHEAAVRHREIEGSVYFCHRISIPGFRL
jgi:hypothetical protein